MFPFLLVSWLLPVGHSGHFKLQSVVGSTVIVEGKPETDTFLNSEENK